MGPQANSWTVLFHRKRRDNILWPTTRIIAYYPYSCIHGGRIRDYLRTANKMQPVHLDQKYAICFDVKTKGKECSTKVPLAVRSGSTHSFEKVSKVPKGILLAMCWVGFDLSSNTCLTSVALPVLGGGWSHAPNLYLHVRITPRGVSS